MIVEVEGVSGCGFVGVGDAVVADMPGICSASGMKYFGQPVIDYPAEVGVIEDSRDKNSGELRL